MELNLNTDTDKIEEEEEKEEESDLSKKETLKKIIIITKIKPKTI